jgi:hypothetical protein
MDALCIVTGAGPCLLCLVYQPQFVAHCAAKRTGLEASPPPCAVSLGTCLPMHSATPLRRSVGHHTACSRKAHSSTLSSCEGPGWGPARHPLLSALHRGPVCLCTRPPHRLGVQCAVPSSIEACCGLLCWPLCADHPVFMLPLLQVPVQHTGGWPGSRQPGWHGYGCVRGPAVWQGAAHWRTAAPGETCSQQGVTQQWRVESVCGRHSPMSFSTCSSL